MKYGYARVSTTKQDFKEQISTLKKWGIAPNNIYKEKKSSVKNRPEYKKMLSKLKPGDTLVVTRFDRFSRTPVEFFTLISDFTSRNINVVSIVDGLDTGNTSPLNEYMVGLSMLQARMERRVTSDRTKEGLAFARAQGRVGGRPLLSSEKIKQAITLYQSNDYSVSEICALVGISKSSLYKYIRNAKITT